MAHVFVSWSFILRACDHTLDYLLAVGFLIFGIRFDGNGF